MEIFRMLLSQFHYLLVAEYIYICVSHSQHLATDIDMQRGWLNFNRAHADGACTPPLNEDKNTYILIMYDEEHREIADVCVKIVKIMYYSDWNKRLNGRVIVSW